MSNQKSNIVNHQSQILKVGIIGSGTMGSGIAQVAATSGCIVKLYDTSQAALDKAKTALDKILSRLIEKGRIDQEEKQRIQSNISYVDSLRDLADSDLTIEAIIENLDIKQKVFAELETYVSEDCIIASNTSSLSIASIASSLQKPKRCIGIHFRLEKSSSCSKRHTRFYCQQSGTAILW